MSRHSLGVLLAGLCVVAVLVAGAFALLLRRAKHRSQFLSTRSRERNPHWTLRVDAAAGRLGQRLSVGRALARWRRRGARRRREGAEGRR